jgi:hypothetical protein
MFKLSVCFLFVCLFVKKMLDNHTGRTRVKLAREPRVRLHCISVEKSVTDVVVRKIRGGSNMGMMI